MKKLYLFPILLLCTFPISFAQTRLSLYEEFTGENCSPCAFYNPGLDSLTINASNSAKVLVLKYQMPFGGATTIYAGNPEEADIRSTFYNIPSLPQGRLDGNVPFGTTGNIADMTQSIIDNAAAVPAPFTITLSGTTIGTSSLSVNVTITANTSVALGSALKLRVALVEDLMFETPPGSNGELEFPHVVREMYPNANGQSLTGTWAAGATQTISITGSVPSIVNAKNYKFLAVWIQDDASWSIKQAARSFSTNEVAAVGLVTEATPICGNPSNVSTTAIIRNLGSAPLTSATIYFKEESTMPWQIKNWTGLIPFQGTAAVSLNPITISSIGTKFLIDSVANPNGQTDAFTSNNKSKVEKIVLQNVGGISSFSENFESASNGFVPYALPNKVPLFVASSAGTTGHYGYDGSDHYLYRNNRTNSIGNSGYAIFPFVDLSGTTNTLEFYMAYAQAVYSGSVQGQDKLEVLYSTDCGSSWNVLWSLFGPALATTTPSGGRFIPTSNSQWAKRTVDLSTVPTGAQLAFRATSILGNDLYIDNINVSSSPTSIGDITLNDKITLHPNPSTDILNVTLNSNTPAESTIHIVNVAGQILFSNSYNLVSGENNIRIKTSGLATGIYFANIISKEGTTQRKFVKK